MLATVMIEKEQPMISSARILLGIYIVFLLWLILFKTSLDFLSVLADYQMKSLNLVPFVDFSQANLREIIDNFIVFVPLGLLLAINLRRVSIWQRLGCIAAFSFSVEAIQYALAIGVTDITDVISNTAGGLFGLLAYAGAARFIGAKKLNQFIVSGVAAVLLLFLLLRFMVFKVKY